MIEKKNEERIKENTEGLQAVFEELMTFRRSAVRDWEFKRRILENDKPSKWAMDFMQELYLNMPSINIIGKDLNQVLYELFLSATQEEK